MLLLLILSAHADVPEKNMQDLQDVAQYFTTEPWTLCDYNGYSVDCRKLAEFKANLDKAPKQDPNEGRMP